MSVTDGRITPRQRLDRIVAKTKLGTGYFRAPDLERMTGQGRRMFAAVVLKELLDNALDACETAGVAPEVSVVVRENEESYTIEVSDNAGGIPPEMIPDILDFDVKVSDKSPYVSPTRGQQGNAWKTILGIPHALGGRGPVVIEALGIRHTIHAWIDPAEEVAVSHEMLAVEPTRGTTVRVTLPSADQIFEPELWVRGAALYNPHAFLRLSYQGDLAGTLLAEMYKPTVPTPEKFRKIGPKDPTSPHWYDRAALERLIYTHIKDARDGGRDLPLGEFIRQFQGLKRPEKAKAASASLNGQVRHLSDFVKMDERSRYSTIHLLLEAMKKESEAPMHKALGKLGKPHFQARFEQMYGIVDPSRVWYQNVEGVQYGKPYRFEVALAETEDEGHLFTGINYSPAFGDPFGDMALHIEGISAFGLVDFLKALHVLPHESIWATYGRIRDAEQPHTVVAIHFVSPVVRYKDLGKSTIDTKGLR